MRKGLLLICALLCTNVLLAQTTFTIGDLTYQTIGSSTVEVYDCDTSATIVIIPSTVTYQGTTYTVTSIGLSAFSNCTGLTSITIPNSVTSIGSGSFSNCTGLTSVTIPNSVTFIGMSAFNSCTGLTSVTIGNSVTYIGDYAFYNCTGLTSVTIPNSVTSIGSEAFHNTSFYNNNSNWTNGVLYKDNCLLTAKTTLSGNYNIIANTRLIAGSAFANSTGLNSVTIPNSVTSIGGYAFRDCAALTSVTIPNSVTSIGGYAFYACSGLTSITIGDSVTFIGMSAFSGCSSLTTLNFNAINCGDFNLSDHPFTNCPILRINIGDSVQRIPNYFASYLDSLTSITIGNSVVSIGDGAFAYCRSLTSVTIPNSVTTIGSYAFYNCTDLTFVTISNSVDAIREYTFASCIGLTSVIIPDSVTSIGEHAFSDCIDLTSITIGNSVTSIGESAFIGCSNLRDVTSLAVTPPTLGTTVFSVAGILKVPCGSLSAYRYSSWLDYFTIMEEICDNMTITVTSANESMGTVSGGGEYEFGEEVTITAIPNEGYRFVSWNDGNTDNPRTITVTEDATYIASFEEGVGIESRDMLSELAFYPNPTSGIITFNRNDIMKVEVLDAMGRTVEVYENAYTIDISKLAKGYYTMRVTTPEGVAVRKVIRK